MSDRLPWFKCDPAKLLGALGGMQPDEALVYVTVLLRIYEVGGPIRDTARTLSRRTGLPEKRVQKALDSVAVVGRISIENGLIDSSTTHEFLSGREESLNNARESGHRGGIKRAKNAARKEEQYQQTLQASLKGSIPNSKPPSTNRDLEEDTEEGKQEEAKALALVHAPLFAEFWRIWPHKVGFQKAVKSFSVIAKQSDYNHEALMDGTRDYIANKPHDRSWLNPATFLNQRRFEDRPYPAQKPPRTVQDAAHDLHQLALDGLQFPPVPPPFTRERNAARIAELHRRDSGLPAITGDGAR